MFCDLDIDSKDNSDDMLADPIPVANVDGHILKKIVDWCEHHKDDMPTSKIRDRFAHLTTLKAF